MSQWAKGVTTKLDSLSLVSKTHMIEEDKELHRLSPATCPPPIYTLAHVHMHTDRQTDRADRQPRKKGGSY